MKKNSWGKSIIYLIIIVALYLIGTMILTKHYNEARRTFLYKYWLITLVNIIFFGGIGVVLGFDKFLIELKKKGKWKLDMSKLIFLGIPSLIFSIPDIVLRVIQLSNSFSNIFTLSSIIFGNVLISIPYKDSLVDK